MCQNFNNLIDRALASDHLFTLIYKERLPYLHQLLQHLWNQTMHDAGSAFHGVGIFPAF